MNFGGTVLNIGDHDRANFVIRSTSDVLMIAKRVHLFETIFPMAELHAAWERLKFVVFENDPYYT